MPVVQQAPRAAGTAHGVRRAGTRACRRRPCTGGTASRACSRCPRLRRRGPAPVVCRHRSILFPQRQYPRWRPPKNNWTWPPSRPEAPQQPGEPEDPRQPRGNRPATASPRTRLFHRCPSASGSAGAAAAPVAGQRSEAATAPVAVARRVQRWLRRRLGRVRLLAWRSAAVPGDLNGDGCFLVFCAPGGGRG